MTLAEFLLARFAEEAQYAETFRLEGPWHNARVLAEIEAKRRIVEWFTKPSDLLILRCLALPYADHPDYRQEWKP